MGCVHGRPTTASPAAPVTSSRRRDHPAVSQPQQEGVDSSDAAAAPAEAGAAPEQQAPEKPEKPAQVKRERRSRSSRSATAAAAAAAHADVRLGGSFANKARDEQVAAGWPACLSAVTGEAINGWTPRCADSFEKIDKACAESRRMAAYEGSGERRRARDPDADPGGARAAAGAVCRRGAAVADVSNDARHVRHQVLCLPHA